MEKPKGRLREKIDVAVDCMCRLSLGACSIMTCDFSLAASPLLSRSVPDTSHPGSLKERLGDAVVVVSLFSQLISCLPCVARLLVMRTPAQQACDGMEVPERAMRCCSSAAAGHRALPRL